MAEQAQVKNPLEYEWMVRPCFQYKDEYSDCTSIKSRFNQYFVHGENTNCESWQTDYNNCKLWKQLQDETAFNALVQSEEKRRMDRLRPHYANSVWKKRQEPPKNWNTPLPDWLQEENAVSFLGVKVEEMQANKIIEKRTMCTIS
ncbi:UPF0545 protein C22orf39 homolog [Athalia rosae]|uniref:UPF0545 protein C22orf39 homolog n=1 Tax=Athalia rosae TaxID=37344 RepID=UPI0020343F4B|nr:UPF0545 protein C22orf39 homolog [Athalia rosae]XP_020708258.2 UPF0545 protein C22orf39 homolog [Athalia rosae]